MSADADVKPYQRRKRLAALLHTAFDLFALAVLALLGPALDVWLRPLTGDCRWLRLFAHAVALGVALELAVLPLAFWSGYLLEHRFGLSNQTFPRWCRQRLLGYAVGTALLLPLLFGFYALIWLAGPWWWLLAAAAGWLFVTVVLGQLLPVLVLPLFYKVTPLNDAAMSDRLGRLAEGTGINLAGVFRLHLSDETKKANAALTGMGRTRRVLLGDTLLDQFPPEEIDVVFAHELGHHVHRHLPKLIAASVLLTGVGFWLVDVLAGRLAPALGYASFSDPAALPLVLLVLSLFTVVTAPLLNALSRHFEFQSDRYALTRTGDPAAFRACFTRLAALNKADPDPPALFVWLLDDHPPIRARLAQADSGATR